MAVQATDRVAGPQEVALEVIFTSAGRESSPVATLELTVGLRALRRPRP